jgi:hypothetical protein
MDINPKPASMNPSATLFRHVEYFWKELMHYDRGARLHLHDVMMLPHQRIPLLLKVLMDFANW